LFAEVELEAIARRALALFSAQLCLSWLYVLIDRPGESRADDFIDWLDRTAMSIGKVLPKATSYSTYFGAAGMADLAREIMSVYGACIAIFALNALLYLCWAFVDGREMAKKLSPSEQYISKFAFLAAALAAYSAVVGLGLMPPSHFGIPDESTNGDYVIGWEILDFAAALGFGLYALEALRISYSNVRS
jgi:hypothetical protein